jgi:hypothetical protein
MPVLGATVQTCRVVPPYPQVILSKTYRGYVKPGIIPNTIQGVSGEIVNILDGGSMDYSE